MAVTNLTQSSASVGMPRLMRVTNAQGWRLWVNLASAPTIRTTSPTTIEMAVNGHVVTVSGRDAQDLRDALNRSWIIDTTGEWV